MRKSTVSNLMQVMHHSQVTNVLTNLKPIQSVTVVQLSLGNQKTGTFTKILLQDVAILMSVTESKFKELTIFLQATTQERKRLLFNSKASMVEITTNVLSTC